MVQPVLLKVEGAVEHPLSLVFEDLARLPAAVQVLDVSRFHPTRQGDGVTLEALLERARPHNEANYLTLHADRDDFHVSIPLQAVRGEGIVVYRLGESGLGLEHGGPIREGEESRGQPVRYTGQVTGDTMTLTVTPEGSDSSMGSYKLARGKTGRIHKCL